MLSVSLNKAFPFFLPKGKNEEFCDTWHLETKQANALNTFYLWLYSVRHTVKDHSDKEETCWHFMGYSFWSAARDLLNASSFRQDSTYHILCYISCGALAGMSNSSMVLTKRDQSNNQSHNQWMLYHRALSCSPAIWNVSFNLNTMK